jgi:hypothetical protein
MPEWAACLEMAGGNPLTAKQIYEELDAEWWYRWHTWRNEIAEAKK